MSKLDSLTNENVFNSKNVHMSVSAHSSSMGTVIKCSNSITDLLGISTSNIIGKNISSIMPSFIGDVHNELMF